MRVALAFFSPLAASELQTPKIKVKWPKILDCGQNYFLTLKRLLYWHIVANGCHDQSEEN